MNWASRRRLIIIAIITGFIVLFGVLPYWILHRQDPTCYDGARNGLETGVDCGGSCSLVCREAVRDPKILWANIFASRPGVYDVVAYIENSNFNIAAPRVPYVITLKDAQDKTVTTVSGETWIGPNERFALFEGNIRTGDRIPTTAIVSFSPNIPWYVAKKGDDLFTVAEKRLTDPDKFPKLSATLRSLAPEVIRNIQATVIVYDAQGAPIGASATRVEKLDQGGSEQLLFTWPKPFLYEAGSEQCATPVDVVLLLDRSGSMRSDGKNPDEPLTSAKNAAVAFVDRMTVKDQLAFVSFATDATYPLDQTLTPLFDRVKKAIRAVVIKPGALQYTNIGDALYRAGQELLTFRHDPEAKPVVVLLTDGEPTMPKDELNANYPVEYAFKRADELKAGGVSIYTIGLGNEVRGEFLEGLATSPEYYFPAASRGDLGDVYSQIATAVCKKGPSVYEIIPRVNTVSSLGERAQ